MTILRKEQHKATPEKVARIAFLAAIAAIFLFGTVVRTCLNAATFSETLLHLLIPAAAAAAVCVLLSKTRFYEFCLCRRSVISLIIIGMLMLTLVAMASTDLPFEHHWEGELIVPLAILGISIAVYSLRETMSIGIAGSMLLCGLFLLVTELCDEPSEGYAVLAAGMAVLVFALFSGWFRCESPVFAVWGGVLAAFLGGMLFLILECDFGVDLFQRANAWLELDRELTGISPSVCLQTIARAKFIGAASPLPAHTYYSALTEIACKLGWILLPILGVLLVAVLVSGCILLKYRRGLTRLLGVGLLGALAMEFTGFILGSIGVDFGQMPTALPFFTLRWATNLGYVVLCTIFASIRNEPAYGKDTQLMRELRMVWAGSIGDANEDCLTVRQFDLSPSLRRELRETFTPAEGALVMGNTKLLDSLNNAKTVCVMRCIGDIDEIQILFRTISVEREIHFFLLRTPNTESAKDIFSAVTAMKNAATSDDVAVTIDPCLKEDHIELLVLGI